MARAANDKAAELREMAANRGCRLVRSRRRKPGGDFGRYGLTDAKSGKEVFGFGKAGLEASAEEIADFLRKGTASTWKSSVGAVGKRKGRAAASRPAAQPKRDRPKASPAVRRKAEAKPRARSRSEARESPGADSGPPAPAVAPPLRIRVADAVDGEAVASFLAELDIEASADEISDRIGRLSRMGEPLLLAKLGEDVAGCASWHVVPMLHHALPVGRVTLLVVAARARRRGIGTALLQAVEQKLAKRGCGQVEMVAGLRGAAAETLGRGLGYRRAGNRIAKQLAPAGTD